MAHRAADRLRGQVGPPPLPGELRGDFAIGGGAAIGDLPQKLPYILLKIRAHGVERRQKIGLLPGEICVEPARGFPQEGRLPLRVMGV